MPSKCKKCDSSDNYNFVLNIGLCNPCIGERIKELKIENAKLNIILFHRENGLSHPDFNAEIEISKQAERIEELEAGQLDFAKETTRIHKTKIQRIKELENLLQPLIWIAEKATTDDSEDTTIELARQVLR